MVGVTVVTKGFTTSQQGAQAYRNRSIVLHAGMITDWLTGVRMNKMIFGLLAGLVLGGIAGAMVAQQSMHQRQQSLAVMWLMQRHLDAAARAPESDCQQARTAVQRVGVMSDELVSAFPMAYQQDQTFHRYVEQVSSAASDAQQAQCALMSQKLKDLRETCEQCHRDYR